jgi:hypothetical protein
MQGVSNMKHVNPSGIVRFAAAAIAAALTMGESLAVVPHRALGELGREAERIVQGRVVETRAAWSADRSMIHTYVQVQVERTVKGRERRNVVFRVMGGEIGDLGVVVPDAPRFRTGEDVLVLLDRDDSGYLSVHGWSQGKIEIEDGFAPQLGLPASELAGILAGDTPDPTTTQDASTDSLALCTISCDTSTPLTRWPQPGLNTPYLVNPEAMEGCTKDDWLNAVTAAAETWNATLSSFAFVPGGTTNLTSKGAQPDGHNVIHVGSTGGSLAYTIIWYDPPTGVIIENDLVVSKTKRFFKWSCGATAAAGVYDVQSAVTHELGHFLFLDDLTPWDCRDLTMYGALYPGDLGKRTLELPDECGIVSLYP